jgi:hypothetical protein
LTACLRKRGKERENKREGLTARLNRERGRLGNKPGIVTELKVNRVSYTKLSVVLELNSAKAQYHIPSVALTFHVKLVPFCSPKLISVVVSPASETLTVVKGKKSQYKRPRKIK